MKIARALLPSLPLVLLIAGCASHDGGIPGIKEVYVRRGQRSVAKQYFKTNHIEVLGGGNTTLHQRPDRDDNYFVIPIPPFNEREFVRNLQHQPFVYYIKSVFGMLDPIEHSDATLRRATLFNDSVSAPEAYNAAGKQKVQTWLDQWLDQHPGVRLARPITSIANCYYFFELTGPSRTLSEGKNGYWEKLRFFILLHPPFSSGRGEDQVVIARFTVEGRLAKWPESSSPPESRFAEYSFPQLQTFLRGMIEDIEKHYGSQTGS